MRLNRTVQGAQCPIYGFSKMQGVLGNGMDVTVARSRGRFLLSFEEQCLLEDCLRRIKLTV